MSCMKYTWPCIYMYMYMLYMPVHLGLLIAVGGECGKLATVTSLYML